MREKPVVLVADEDKETAQDVARLLRPEGFIVHPCHGAPWALEAAVALRPDAVVLGASLLSFDSGEIRAFIQRLRLDAPDARIILLLPELMARAGKAWTRQCGVDGFLAKPVRKEALMDEISGLLI